MDDDSEFDSLFLGQICDPVSYAPFFNFFLQLLILIAVVVIRSNELCHGPRAGRTEHGCIDISNSCDVR